MPQPERALCPASEPSLTRGFFCDARLIAPKTRSREELSDTLLSHSLWVRPTQYPHQKRLIFGKLVA
jgi:hypothetical protein